MIFFILLVVLGVLLYDHFRKKPDYSHVESPLETQVRQKIVQQIESVAGNEKDSAIKQGMMRATGIAKSGAVAVAANMDESPTLKNPNLLTLSSNPDIHTASATSAASAVALSKTKTPSPPQSNAITLLYVGAFLFVTAIIIFIAAPVLSGGVKTMLVLLTAILFYGLGLWLHQASKIFRPAGQTFVAIGMVILPLAGIAAYNLVFDKQHA